MDLGIQYPNGTCIVGASRERQVTPTSLPDLNAEAQVVSSGKVWVSQKGHTRGALERG